jgi:proline dehydrogenase
MMPGIVDVSAPAFVTGPLDRLLRALLLGAADSATARVVVARYGMRLGASRFVAGETIDECVPVLRRLNGLGLVTNTTVLGERVRDRAEAAALAGRYEAILDRIDAEGLRCNLAVKPTQLGLLLGEGLAYDIIARLVDHAAGLGNFVRIDMEQSEHVDATLGIYLRLRESGRDAVGCALQSYLRRSEEDLRRILPLRPNVRLVKGAYLEPASIAYERKSDVDACYVRLLEQAVDGGAYAAVATHDDRLIEHAFRVTERAGVGRDGFEVQMLYGVRPQRQVELAGLGHRVRVATPFGPDWYRYLMRRLAERPANLGFVLRSLVHR